jgi:hypothetical protein
VTTPPPPPPGGGVSGPLAPTRPGSPRPGDPSFVGPVASKPVDFQSLLTSAPPPGAPLTLGRSPGSLDLSLPTNPELQTAATPDPWRARDRFAAGNPTEISTLGEAFAKAGGDFEEAHALSTQTQKLLAAGYTNDATPVYDQATHIASLPKNFPDAPTRLSSIGKQLGTTATELSTRTTTAAAAVNTLLDTLDQKRAAWQNEWQAARNPDGLIPFDQIDALLARRTTVAAQMQTTVNTTGATIGASVTAYEGILADGMKVLSTIGYVPPDNLDAGPGDTNYDTATARDRAADLTSAVQDGANPATMGRVTDALAPIATLNAVEAAGGTLTPEQQAFRRDFYQGAGGDTLSGLAGLVNKAAPGPSADAALATAGNGIMNLSRYHDGAYIPEAVNGMVSQRLGVAAHDPSFPSGGTRRLDDGSVQVAGVARYEGTAALLAASTTPGGANFVHQVGESALQAKQDLNTTGRPPGWLAVVPTTGIPAVDDVFAAGAHKFSADVTRAGESPINTMLGVVARDPAASQALLGAPKDGFIYPHDPGRQTLLGAGWTDGSGAAAVLRSATAPAQSTPQLATNSAALTGTIISEIGEDPAGWRKLIPKGSAVSDQLTALAADRIDSFAYPQGSSHLLQPTVHNADGSYTTPLRLGLDLGRPDERVPFLNFVARGGDVHHAGADPDMIRIRAAADDFTINSLSDAIRHGPPDGSGPRGFDNALTGPPRRPPRTARSPSPRWNASSRSGPPAASRRSRTRSTSPSTASCAKGHSPPPPRRRHCCRGNCSTAATPSTSTTAPTSSWPPCTTPATCRPLPSPSSSTVTCCPSTRSGSYRGTRSLRCSIWRRRARTISTPTGPGPSPQPTRPGPATAAPGSPSRPSPPGRSAGPRRPGSDTATGTEP